MQHCRQRDGHYDVHHSSSEPWDAWLKDAQPQCAVTAMEKETRGQDEGSMKGTRTTEGCGKERAA